MPSLNAAEGGSAGLFVDRVLAVPAAVLGELDTLPVVLLVLHGDLVAPLAHVAGQRHLHPLLVLGHVDLLPGSLSCVGGSGGRT